MECIHSFKKKKKVSLILQRYTIVALLRVHSDSIKRQEAILFDVSVDETGSLIKIFAREFIPSTKRCADTAKELFL